MWKIVVLEPKRFKKWSKQHINLWKTVLQKRDPEYLDDVNRTEQDFIATAFISFQRNHGKTWYQTLNF